LHLSGEFVFKVTYLLVIFKRLNYPKMNTNFDAIVIGSGISGGWAAKVLCEQGLKTCIVERGRNVEHNKDYPTALLQPWEFPHAGWMPKAFRDENPLITKAAGFGEDTAHFFIKDNDQPYVQKKPFDWIRGFQVGGKSLTWGRACQRWSQSEFESPSKYNYGIQWPVDYAEMAPWYHLVEDFIGVCGNKDGLESMPDGEFLPPFEMNCVEQHMSTALANQYPDRHLVHGRWAHLTKPKEHHLELGRGKCQARNLCMRGCPFGAYFSSNSSTIPSAQRTGNLSILSDAVVVKIIYDDQQKKATGIEYIDTATGSRQELKASIIFVNASALNSNLILLNSTSDRFPNGLGNDHDILGRYVGFHNYRGYASGRFEGFKDTYVYGRNPSELILANFRNVYKHEMPFVGGYTIFSGAYRSRNEEAPENGPGIGAAYKEGLRLPGDWRAYMYMQGETIPKASNRIYLSDTEKDPWGIPQLVMDVNYDDNDELMVQDFLKESKAMLEVMGCSDIEQNDSKQAPGLDIHEMGGCRMGANPKTSMLNKYNQLHLCHNVFVTDGACMTSTGNQSPSLLYMAFTARAATYAAEQFKAQSI